MGQSLIVSWTKLIKNGDIKNAQEALQAIETKVALMLQLLIHEDDDISSNIIGFCYDYLHTGVPPAEGHLAHHWLLLGGPLGIQQNHCSFLALQYEVLPNGSGGR